MPKRNTVTSPAPASQALIPTGAADLLPFNQRIVAGTVSPRSLQKYAEHFRAYCAFAATADAARNPATLARWRTALVAQEDPVLAPDTINLKLAAIRSIMAAAAEQGYLPGDVADAFRRVRGVSVKALKARRSPHRRQRITATQMRALCEAPDASTLKGVRDRALLHTLASSGMRASATATLTYPQITQTDQGMGIWMQDKNDTEPRLCLLSREAWQWLDQWRTARMDLAEQVLADDADRAKGIMSGKTVFLAFDGRGERRLSPYAMTPTAIWQVVQQYAREIGMAHIKPHDFRRFLGTRLAAQDIRVAQKALGHKDIRTTALHYVLDELTLGQSDDLY
jgi:site-specific recombinase XerD